MISRQYSTGSWLVTMVEPRPCRSSMISKRSRRCSGNADDGGSTKILANRRSADADRDGDLPLAHAKGVSQSQNFANLPHRRSLGGRRTSPCMAVKGASSAIRSPTSRASGRAHHGGRLQSEWVADFRRNRWPHCVGTTSRFASNYACRSWRHSQARVARSHSRRVCRDPAQRPQPLARFIEHSLRRCCREWHVHPSQRK
jgi:hypothetical protein